MHVFRSLLLSGILASLTACATKPASEDGTVPVEERQLPTGVEQQTQQQEQVVHEQASRQQQQQHPAVIALLDESQRSMSAGEKESAIAALERGLRLQPKNALLWHRLAQAHLENKDWQQALILAQKSISLAAGDEPLQSGNWEIIAQARKALGDRKGARKAMREVERLSAD